MYGYQGGAIISNRRGKGWQGTRTVEEGQVKRKVYGKETETLGKTGHGEMRTKWGKFSRTRPTNV